LEGIISASVLANRSFVIQHVEIQLLFPALLEGGADIWWLKPCELSTSAVFLLQDFWL